MDKKAIWIQKGEKTFRWATQECNCQGKPWLWLLLDLPIKVDCLDWLFIGSPHAGNLWVIFWLMGSKQLLSESHTVKTLEVSLCCKPCTNSPTIQDHAWGEQDIFSLTAHAKVIITNPGAEIVNRRQEESERKKGLPLPPGAEWPGCMRKFFSTDHWGALRSNVGQTLKTHTNLNPRYAYIHIHSGCKWSPR